MYNVLGFSSAQAMREHYEHVARFEVSNVHLFEREHGKTLDDDKHRATTRAFDRIADLVIRVYPPVPNKDMYFVNIAEVRPHLARNDQGIQSFFRAMRRAGLMRPLRSPHAVQKMWGDYLHELRISLGLEKVAPSPAVRATTAMTVVQPGPQQALVPAAPYYSPPQSPLSSPPSPTLPVTVSPLPIAPETAFEPLFEAPESPHASSDDSFAGGISLPDEVMSVSAPPSSGVRDDWSEHLTDILSDASSEELTDLCRDLAGVINSSVLT